MAVLVWLIQRFPLSFSMVCIFIVLLCLCLDFFLFPKKAMYVRTQSTTGQLKTRKTGGSDGGKVSGGGETITFADVAGVDEAKEELEEIVVGFRTLKILHMPIDHHTVCASCLYRLNQTLQEFLRNPDKYVRLGARPPRGVLLVSQIILFHVDSTVSYVFVMVYKTSPL